MAHCPDIQAKAQEELDRVVGSDRLPNSADEPDLKYIRAIIKEALRIKDPAPLGNFFFFVLWFYRQNYHSN